MAKTTRSKADMASDKRQDSKVMRGMTAAQKAAWKKADEKKDRNMKSRAEDARGDKKLTSQVKRKVR